MSMKVFWILVLCLFFQACNKYPFTGYIVGKEYIPRHWENKPGKSICECAVWIPVVPAHTSTDQRKIVESQFILHVANKDELRHIHVDSLLYQARKCGEKITINK